jgi:hypothetical protein
LAVSARSPFLAQRELLIPSLGSAIFLQTTTPEEPSARAWNTGIGQLIGAAAGFGTVFLATAEWTPHFMGSNPLTIARVAAAAITSANGSTRNFGVAGENRPRGRLNCPRNRMPMKFRSPENASAETWFSARRLRGS